MGSPRIFSLWATHLGSMWVSPAKPQVGLAHLGFPWASPAKSQVGLAHLGFPWASPAKSWIGLAHMGYTWAHPANTQSQKFQQETGWWKFRKSSGSLCIAIIDSCWPLLVNIKSRSSQGHVQGQGHSQGHTLKSNFRFIGEGHRLKSRSKGQGQGHMSRSNPEIDPRVQRWRSDIKVKSRSRQGHALGRCKAQGQTLKSNFTFVGEGHGSRSRSFAKVNVTS